MANQEFLNRIEMINGNCGDDSWAHNGSWYDKTGTKIGWGDVGQKDLAVIQAGLKDDEVLFVLGESDSYWDLPKGMDPDKPGLKFVLAKVRFYITNKGTFQIVPKGYMGEAKDGANLVYREELGKLFGLRFKFEYWSGPPAGSLSWILAKHNIKDLKEAIRLTGLEGKITEKDFEGIANKEGIEFACYRIQKWDGFWKVWIEGSR